MEFLLDPTFTEIEYIIINNAVDEWNKVLPYSKHVFLKRVNFSKPLVGIPTKEVFKSKYPRVIRSNILQLSFLFSNGLRSIKGHRDRVKNDIWLAHDVDISRLRIITIHEFGHWLANRGDHLEKGIMSWNGDSNTITQSDMDYILK